MESKVCTRCGESKILACFYAENRRGGFRQPCKQCVCLDSKAWYSKNADRKAATVNAWVAANASRKAEANASWRRNNRLKSCAYTSKWKQANREKVNDYKRRYRSINPEAVARHELHRKTTKRQARPCWANGSLVGDIYRLAKIATKATGIRFTVDHVVPLRSKLVCGLHCEANLTVIPWVENSRKGNRWWPDMPGEPYPAPERAPDFSAIAGQE